MRPIAALVLMMAVVGLLLYSATDWLNANAGALSAVATVALTLFAGVELWRGRKVTERANAEVGAHAYAFRRQLNSIIGGPSYLSGAELKEHAQQVAARHYQGAERRALAIVTAAGGASEGIARPARRAYVLFYQAADHINAVSEAHPQSDGWERWERWEDAMDLLEECVTELGNAIPKELREPDGDSLVVRQGLRKRLMAGWDATMGEGAGE